MKRKNNGLIVGTILIVLVGALIMLQAANQEPTDEPEAGPPAPKDGAHGPRVDEHLDNKGGGPSRGPILMPQ